MSWLENTRVGVRLGLGFGVVIVLMIASVVVALREGEIAHEELERIVKSNNVRLALANIMIDNARETAIVVRDVLLARYKNEPIAIVKKRRDDIAEPRRTHDEAADKLREAMPKEDTKGLEQLNRVVGFREATGPLQDQVIELAIAGKPVEGIALMTGKAYPTVKRWIASLGDLIHHNEELNALHYEQAEKARAAARTITLILGAATIGLSAIISVLLTSGITRPLHLAVQAANRISVGDLTVDVSAAANRGDELGLLAQSLRSMVAKLRELPLLMLDGVTALASSSSQIVASTVQMSTSASESAAAISETTATIEEVRQTAKLSSEKAKQVSDTAQKAAQISQGGRKATQDVAFGMHRIREQMEAIATSMMRLSEQSQTIGQIMTTVEDLAAQSNLLAVNAAIEAANAGEHGKGFGVVAQEVKSLAEQSRQATNQVRTILNDVQKATTAAVMATELGGKGVEAGTPQTEVARESIQALAESVTEAAQAAAQIAASSRQQLAGVDQVVAAMESIKQASTQNMSGAKQLETAARNLDELGQRLKQVVEKYKV